MKTKNFWQFILFLIFGVVFQLSAQDTKVLGNWSGKLELPNTKLEMIFKITTDEAGKLISKLDVPAQGAKDLQVADTKVNGDSLHLNVAMIFGKYEGKLTSDSTIEGNWKQSGMSIPLSLVKTNEVTELKRPQTPIPPFPYLSEEVTYTNSVSGFKIAGTLTLPENSNECPAAILISGSGAQDRDETIFEHKPFLVIADFLTRNGIAVLRLDDRGVGGSEGKTSEATSEDFAGDVIAGIEFLKTKKEINSKKIGLIGQSEGGLIAPIVANRFNATFVVLLAGPGIIGEQILYDQGILLGKAAGLTDSQVFQNKKMQEAIFSILKAETDSANRTDGLQRTMSNGMYVMLNDEQKSAIDNQIKAIDNNWFRFFLQYDPYPALTKVKCQVLALNGEKDLQVPPKPNLAAIEKALTEGGNPNFKTLELPGLNHLFQTCKTGAVSEYAQIEETISPTVLEILLDWILNYGIKN